MKTKMDSVIDKMEDIIEKKRKPEKEGKVRGIDEENIENLVRKIVFEALEKPKEKTAPHKKDDKNNLNALDAILENLLLESYSEGNEVVEEEEPDVKKSTKPKGKKTMDENNIKTDSDTQPSLDTEDLVDKIVESIFPLVSKLSSVQRDSDEEEIDDEVGVMMTIKKFLYSLSHEQVILKDSAKEELEEEDSLEVVHRALSAIIGDKPTEEQKLTPEVNLLFTDLCGVLSSD